jgi:glutathione peroxidase
MPYTPIRFCLVMALSALAFGVQANPAAAIGGVLQGAQAGPVGSARAGVGCPEVLRHQATLLLAEKPKSLCEYSGQVVLVVNTASQCGFTPQYQSLNTLFNRYRRHGLVVLGFPANDFAAQEPGSNDQIAKFCAINYGVSFPMFGKLSRPIQEDPLFVNLTRASGSHPRWNFHKYLVDKQGKVISFDSATDPLAPNLIRAVETALAAGR